MRPRSPQVRGCSHDAALHYHACKMAGGGRQAAGGTSAYPPRASPHLKIGNIDMHGALKAGIGLHAQQSQPGNSYSPRRCCLCLLPMDPPTYTQLDCPTGAPSAGSGAVTCMVCLSDVRPSDATAMSCGHAFCNGCWKEHMRIGIADGLSKRLRCMQPSCGVICDEDTVRLGGQPLLPLPACLFLQPGAVLVGLVGSMVCTMLLRAAR
jgi:hypothetical protein